MHIIVNCLSAYKNDQQKNSRWHIFRYVTYVCIHLTSKWQVFTGQVLFNDTFALRDDATVSLTHQQDKYFFNDINSIQCSYWYSGTFLIRTSCIWRTQFFVCNFFWYFNLSFVLFGNAPTGSYFDHKGLQAGKVWIPAYIRACRLCYSTLLPQMLHLTKLLPCLSCLSSSLPR